MERTNIYSSLLKKIFEGRTTRVYDFSFIFRDRVSYILITGFQLNCNENFNIGSVIQCKYIENLIFTFVSKISEFISDCLHSIFVLCGQRLCNNYRK